VSTYGKVKLCKMY